MKAKIDKDTCIECGLCVDICPDVFGLKENKVFVKKEIIPANTLDAAKEAETSCPVDAIVIE